MSEYDLVANDWPSEHVARTDVGEFTYGLYKASTMAKMDSLGEGPSGSFKVGGRVFYPKDKLTAWLQGRVKTASCAKGGGCHGE